MNWLAHLSRLGPDDLRRISRLVDLLETVDQATHDMARVMLEAKPEPETHQDARDRIGTIVEYLEGVAADDYDAAQAGRLP